MKKELRIYDRSNRGTERMIRAIVPVKDFAEAKQRLGAVLSVVERCRLAELMLCDVLSVLASAFDPESIAIVTKDEQAIKIGKQANVSIIHESENRGETEAVALAVSRLAERESQTMLVLPGDVPCITEEDVEAIVRAGCSANVVLVPSRDERGTNAVLLTPPDALPLRFGTDSFHPHLEVARSRGLRTKVLHLPNVALDIDTPADLEALVACPAHTRVRALLEEIGWTSRCK